MAAALLKGSVTELNFRRLDDPALHRLINMIRLEVDDEMTQAYPGRQGSEVEIESADGKRHRMRLADVVNATAGEVRERFRDQAVKAFGEVHARKVEAFVDNIENAEDAGGLAGLLGVEARAHID